MCCCRCIDPCGICEVISLVLVTLVVAWFAGYATKAIYLASLEGRDPELADFIHESFWEPSGAAFWGGFAVALVIMLVAWFLIHQVCHGCTSCRHRPRYEHGRQVVNDACSCCTRSTQERRRRARWRELDDEDDGGGASALEAGTAKSESERRSSAARKQHRYEFHDEDVDFYEGCY